VFVCLIRPDPIQNLRKAQAASDAPLSKKAVLLSSGADIYHQKECVSRGREPAVLSQRKAGHAVSGVN
jgi:hypothetical protein